MKKKILIVSRHETSFQELYKLYEQINLNEFDVKFFFASQEKIKIKKDSFYDISNDVYNKTLVKCLIKFEKYFYELDKKIPRFSNNILVSLFRLIISIFINLIHYKFFFALLKREKPNLLILSGDRSLYLEIPCNKASIDLKIKTLIGCSSIGRKNGLIPGRAKSLSYSTSLNDFPPLLNFLTRIIFKKQVHQKEKNILFSPGWKCFSYLCIGMLPKNPWVLGASFSKYILAHSKDYYDYLIREQVDKNRIFFIGDQNHVKLYKVWKNKKMFKAMFKKKMNISRKRIILISVPCEAEHNLLSWEVHKSNLFNYLSSFKDCNYDIFFMLHPRSKIENYSFLVQKLNFKLIIDDIENVLPIVDCFICGYSTLTNFTKLIEVPTVIMDFLNLNVKLDFAGSNGFIVSNSSESFAQAINKLDDLMKKKSDPKFKKFCNDRRQDVMFDGNFKTRYHKLLCKLC